MDKPTPTSPRKTGPVPRLGPTERFSMELPTTHRAILDAYSLRHEITVAEALRRAIKLLEKADKKVSSGLDRLHNS